MGEVNRHVRGDVNVPVGGGPDILRAIYGRDLNDDGFLTNVAGDGLYYLVSWNAEGQLSVEGVHQFGSATLDEDSPHYSDQAVDYAQEVLHAPLFDEEPCRPICCVPIGREGMARRVVELALGEAAGVNEH